MAITRWRCAAPHLKMSLNGDRFALIPRSAPRVPAAALYCRLRCVASTVFDYMSIRHRRYGLTYKKPRQGEIRGDPSSKAPPHLELSLYPLLAPSVHRHRSTRTLLPVKLISQSVSRVICEHRTRHSSSFTFAQHGKVPVAQCMNPSNGSLDMYSRNS